MGFLYSTISSYVHSVHLVVRMQPSRTVNYNRAEIKDLNYDTMNSLESPLILACLAILYICMPSYPIFFYITIKASSLFPFLSSHLPSGYFLPFSKGSQQTKWTDILIDLFIHYGIPLDISHSCRTGSFCHHCSGANCIWSVALNFSPPSFARLLTLYSG